MHVSDTGLGGLKKAITAIGGRDVFSRIKFESGVHRVQRVPETEAVGRVHTSAATVAVLPEAEEIDVFNDALAPEIAGFEPRLALAGGSDGLAGHRALAPDVARLLGRRGAAAIEVGAGQATLAAKIMARHGLVETGRRRDLAGIERCLVFRRGGKIMAV